MSRKKLSASIIAFLCVINMFALNAFAADVAPSGLSLTIHCEFDNVIIDNAVFKLYKVADGEKNVFTYLPDFDDGNMPAYTDSLTVEERQAIVTRLEALVAENKPVPLQTGTTDENGNYVFASLETGLYLVLSEETRVIGNETYYPLSLLIHLPFTQDGSSTDKPVSDIKYDKKPVDTTKPSTTTPTESTTKPDKPPKTPKTGQLWWPVYALCGAGTLLVAFGLIGKKKKGEEQ